MASSTVRVKGLKELQAALRKADGRLDLDLRAELRSAGNIVRDEAQSLFSGVDARSAGGYKVKVRARGVSVEQSLRRTTGQHASYGALQMQTALLPALEQNEGEVIRALESMLDGIGRAF